MNPQVGSVPVTVYINVGAPSAVSNVEGINPESMPEGFFTHGAAKVLWVMVWFLERKMKWIMSPTAAVRDSGEYFRPRVVPPTVT